MNNYDNEVLIDILSHVVELKNVESGLHILNVKTITNILLLELRNTDKYFYLTNNDIYIISLASALHDIGKIRIPDEILNKKGKLTDEEYNIIKKHTIYGVEILDKTNLYKDSLLIKTIYEICRWHHERYDGSGYPDGLSGDNIPLSAQIVSIADVLDALTSVRVYKDAMKFDEAINIINNDKDKFNPILIECLMDCKDEIKKAIQRE